MQFTGNKYTNCNSKFAYYMPDTFGIVFVLIMIKKFVKFLAESILYFAFGYLNAMFFCVSILLLIIKVKMVD